MAAVTAIQLAAATSSSKSDQKSDHTIMAKPTTNSVVHIQKTRLARMSGRPMLSLPPLWIIWLRKERSSVHNHKPLPKEMNKPTMRT